MNQFWKISTVVLFCICIALGYYVLTGKKSLHSNEISLNDVNQDDFKYRQKQNPTYSKDLNDYFFKNQTKIRFLKDLYDFDSIKQGRDIQQNIYYVNEGSQPFFITDVKVSCGCTVPSYDKKPVMPKDTGFFQIAFKSKGKEGFVMNKLAVHGNVENGEKSVYFKIYVYP